MSKLMARMEKREDHAKHTASIYTDYWDRLTEYLLIRRTERVIEEYRDGITWESAVQWCEQAGYEERKI